MLDAAQKQRLFDNIAAAMAGVPAEICERQCRHFDKVHNDYGAGVRAALKAADAGYDPNAIPVTEKTSQEAAE